MLPHVFEHLLQHYGYGFVFLTVMFEAMGLPLPGESLLIAAALYASATHHLSIAWLVPVASLGAIMGDNLGYLIGHWAGTRLLVRYGRKVGLTEDRLKLGQFLFRRHGGILVFLGRFVAILRTFVALLAGANRMHWAQFLLWNALGGVAWAGGYSIAAYLLGSAVRRISGPLGIVLGIAAAVAVAFAVVFLKRNERRLTREAVQQMREENG